jgi:hypothetical protein
VGEHTTQLRERKVGPRSRSNDFGASDYDFDGIHCQHLLGSIEANRLVLFCGAGLSIPQPSNLMSAVSVSRFCYDKYQSIAALPPNLRDDVDLLAGHFSRRVNLKAFLSVVSFRGMNSLANQTTVTRRWRIFSSVAPQPPLYRRILIL